MTTYIAANKFGTSGSPTLGVAAGTYPVRIVRIEFFGAQGIPPNSTPAYAYVYNYTGASFSGGTTITPVPMRGGAPPSTATAKYGYTSLSGTKSFLTIISTGGGSGASTTSYTFPFDYILPPGSALSTDGQITLNTSVAWAVAIYYEELRLASSF